MELEEAIKIRRKRKSPSIKQIKAIQYINMGMSKHQAMIKAGYTENTAKSPKQNLMTKQSTRNLLLGLGGQLQDAGLTGEYMIEKFKEWLNAQALREGEVQPDYGTQIKAYDRWKDLVHDDNVDLLRDGRRVKRKITLEEFVKDGE